MISCKKATHLLSERQDRPLALGERVALRLHLAICAGCSAVSRQLEFLRRAVRRLPEAESDV